MQFNRTFLKGVAVLVAVAACSDGAVAPVAPSRGVPLPQIGAGRKPDGDEQVTVTRTIEVQPPAIPGQDAPSPIRRTKTITFGAGTVTAPAEDAVIQEALKTRSRPKITSADDLPVVGLTVPVRSSSFRGAIVPWRRTMNMPDDLATSVESFGTGNAPASMIRVSRDGVVTMTITQAWELWQRQWQLVRRESKSADGSFQEVVSVTREGRAGTALQSPADWAHGVGRLGRGPSFDIYEDDGGGQCPTCTALRYDVDDNWHYLMIALVLAEAACAIPTPITAIACLTAMTVVWAAEVRFQRALQRSQDCICPPKLPKTDDCSRRGVGGRGLTPSLSCASSGGGGGGGGGGDGSPSGEYVCTYYYEYDRDTGEILYAELLSCQYR